MSGVGPEAAPGIAERHRAVYEAAAEGFDRRRSRALFERGWLERFLALVPPGAAVLDLGCGAGEPVARYLIEAGRAGRSASTSRRRCLRSRRARFPGQEWIEARHARAGRSGGGFGGIVAWDSFFHLTADEQRAMFPVFTEHLAPGGGLLFTSGPEAGEASGAVEGAAVYHASLSPGEYARRIEAAGMAVRAFVAEDPECDRHSVWLARKAG